MLESLMGQVGRAFVKRGWVQVCESLKQRGADLIEDPEALVRTLRSLADAIESRKEYFNGESRTEQDEGATPQAGRATVPLDE